MKGVIRFVGWLLIVGATLFAVAVMVGVPTIAIAMFLAKWAMGLGTWIATIGTGIYLASDGPMEYEKWHNRRVAVKEHQRRVEATARAAQEAETERILKAEGIHV